MSTDPLRAAWPAGYERVVLDSVDSTMAEAARRSENATGPIWIIARKQSAAHGRRGRPWAMPAGNFAATLVLRPNAAPEQAALRSFTAAVALHHALSAIIDPSKLSLKWPNDVLLNGGKVAGILLESKGTPSLVESLSIGIGVNLVAAPDAASVEPGAVTPVSVSGAGGRTIDPVDFLDLLATHFASLETQFRAYGFEPIRQLWLKHAARLNEVVTARLPSEEITGTFRTIDGSGHLVLITAKGERRIAAAEVYF
ncbi:MAG: biotin--[acetyl-CoA-carboxylase] ligase [Pseudomonadota bacterium]